MQPLRQRAGCLARSSRSLTQRTVRAYASAHGGEAHHGDNPHGFPTGPTKEPMGAAWWIFMGFVPASLLLYQVSKPGKDGDVPLPTKWIEKLTTPNDVWAQKNALHTDAIKQAAEDRVLFQHGGRSQHVDLAPEILQSHSPRNNSAGQAPNLDHLVEHYRRRHLEEEEKKAVRLAAKADAAAASAASKS